jgi:hypothetical protein
MDNAGSVATNLISRPRQLRFRSAISPSQGGRCACGGHPRALGGFLDALTMLACAA